MDAFGRLPWSASYRVPPDREEDFLALQSQLNEVYGRHAREWSLTRSRADGEEWQEHGPVFREEADHHAAVAELEQRPGVLERLRAFASRDDAENFMRVFNMSEWETVFEVGRDLMPGWTPDDLPDIDPPEMTEAIAPAQNLAKAIAPRLERILPDGFSVRAAHEFVVTTREGEPYTQVGLVDLGIQDAYWAVLNDVADTLTEETTEPWPPDSEPGYNEHIPEVEIREGAVYAWFGSKAQPVLALDPIPLEEIQA